MIQALIDPVSMFWTIGDEVANSGGRGFLDEMNTPSELCSYLRFNNGSDIA
jgi:hypothetical protein